MLTASILQVEQREDENRDGFCGDPGHRHHLPAHLLQRPQLRQQVHSTQGLALASHQPIALTSNSTNTSANCDTRWRQRAQAADGQAADRRDDLGMMRRDVLRPTCLARWFLV